MHSQFLLIVEALAEFWAVMDEIDEHTWVLEPEKPSRADTMRRIAIGKLLQSSTVCGLINLPHITATDLCLIVPRKQRLRKG